jgi:hypothetical protein
MNNLNFSSIKEQLEEKSASNVKLIFITRVIKEGVSQRAKMLQKYDFDAYHIDVDDEIREHLFDTFSNHINRYIEKNYEFQDYQVISDDTEKIITYSLENKTLSFKTVVETQFNQELPKISSLSEILGSHQLWAYCIEVDLGDEKIYSFRKILKSKVAVNESDKPKSAVKRITAMFATDSEQLELVEGETITLEKRVDCIYYQENFYVFMKSQFEQILGLDEEFREEANSVVVELEGLDLIQGLDFIKDQIKNTPALHKKLTRLKSLGNYKSLTKDVIAEMKKIGEEFQYEVKVSEDGQLMIEDVSDVDLVVKLLCDFYKEGRIFKKKYGTFAGKEITS